MAEALQVILEQAHRTEDLVCLCGSAAGRLPVLRPRRLPSGRYVVVRDDMSAHADSCWLKRGNDEANRGDVWSSSVFDLRPFDDGDLLDLEDDRVDAETRDGGSQTSFPRYCRGLLSRGLSDAAWQRNGAGIAGLLQPTAASVLVHVDQAVGKEKFPGGQNGYEIVAGAGSRFRFGYLFSELSPFALMWNVYWWRGDGLSLQTVEVDADVAGQVAKSMSTFGRIRNAPYLLFAVQDQRGTIRRAWLQQIFLRSECLLPVDSGYEANFAGELRHVARDAIILKPLRMEHTIQLLEHAGFAPKVGIDWRFRPDFIVLTRSTSSGRVGVYIREVRGFRRESHPDYNEHLERKLDHYRQLYPEVKDGVRGVDGWSITRKPPLSRPEEWPDCLIDFETSSSAFLENPSR